MKTKRLFSTLLVFVMLLTTVFTMPICSFADDYGTAISSGTWLGMKYDNYDTDGDGKVDTCVLTGEQNGSALRNPSAATFYRNAPYYQNTITKVTGNAILSDGSVLFYECNNLLEINLSGFDTSGVSDMDSMFYSCTNLTTVDLSGFDTSKVTYMSYMFYKCSNLTSLDLSGFGTSKVTDMSYMFYSCTSLTILDMSSFVLSSFRTGEHMFDNCDSLALLRTPSNLASGINLNKTMYDIVGRDYVQLQPGLTESITLCDSPESEYFTTGVPYTIDGVVSGSGIWLGMKYDNYDTDGDGIVDTCVLTGTQTGVCSSTKVEFAPYYKNTITKVTGNATLTNGKNMFSNCSNLTSLDLSSFDTSKVVGMDYMFTNCTSLAAINLSDLDTSKVDTMHYMFYKCSNLTSLDLSDFDTSSVTDMYGMFYKCNNLTTLDLSGFVTSSVTNMSRMFQDCNNLTTLDLTSFDTSSVTDTTSMFDNCTNLATVRVDDTFETSKLASAPVAVKFKSINNFDSSVTLTPSSSAIHCGDTVALTMTIDGSTPWNEGEFNILYDDNIWDYVSSSPSTNVSATTGKVTFEYGAETSETLTREFTFRAKDRDAIPVTTIGSFNLDCYMATADQAQSGVLQKVQTQIGTEVTITPQYFVTFKAVDGSSLAVLTVDEGASPKDVDTVADPTCSSPFLGWTSDDGVNVYAFADLPVVSGDVAYKPYCNITITLGDNVTASSISIVPKTAYTVTLIDYRPEVYNYTLVGTRTDGTTYGAVQTGATNEFIFAGSDMTNNVTVTCTKTPIIAIDTNEYINGYTIIVVSGDNANGYKFDGQAMYKTPHYGSNAHAIVVLGTGYTEAYIKDHLTAGSATPTVYDASTYDINASTSENIADVQAIFNIVNKHNISTVFAEHLDQIYKADIKRGEGSNMCVDVSDVADVLAHIYGIGG